MNNLIVQRHFDGEASTYLNKVSTSLLSPLFKNEQRIILRMLAPKPGERILDAGCGPGTYSKRLIDAGCHVEGVDISPKMVEMAIRNGVKAHLADLQEFELNKIFDKVLCSGSLEFCRDPEKALDRLWVHLKIEGKLLVVFPLNNMIGKFYRQFYKNRGINIHLFKVDTMRKMLVSRGFSVDSHKFTSPFAAALKCTKLPK